MHIMNEVDHSLNVLQFFTQLFPFGGFSTSFLGNIVSLENLTIQLANRILDSFGKLNILPCKLDVSKDRFTVAFNVKFIYEKDNSSKLKSESSFLSSSSVSFGILKVCKIILNELRQLKLNVRINDNSITLCNLDVRQVKEFSQEWKKFNIPIDKIEHLANSKVNLIFSRMFQLDSTVTEDDSNKLHNENGVTSDKHNKSISSNGESIKNKEYTTTATNTQENISQETSRKVNIVSVEPYTSPRSVIISSAPVTTSTFSVVTKLNNSVSLSSPAPISTTNGNCHVIVTQPLSTVAFTSSNITTSYTVASDTTSKLGLSSVATDENLGWDSVQNKKRRKSDHKTTANEYDQLGHDLKPVSVIVTKCLSVNHILNNGTNVNSAMREKGKNLSALLSPPPLSASPMVSDTTKSNQEESQKTSNDINKFNMATDNIDNAEISSTSLQQHKNQSKNKSMPEKISDCSGDSNNSQETMLAPPRKRRFGRTSKPII